MSNDNLEDMGWSPEEAAVMRRIDPAKRWEIVNQLSLVNVPLHYVEVTDDQGTNGYPFRAVCICGWRSVSYCADHAARDMGHHHVTHADCEE